MLHTTTIMISITTVRMVLRSWGCSGMNTFISFWLWFFHTRWETQFLKVFRNHTMLTKPPTFGTSRCVLDLNSSSLVGTFRNGRKLNSMAENSISAPMAEAQLFGFMVQSQILNFSTRWSDPNWIFFKIFQILSPSLLGMTSSTLQPHFLSMVCYDNGDCHILCARA